MIGGQVADRYIEKILDGVGYEKPEDLDKLSERIRVRRQALPLSSSSRVEILGISKQILAFGGAGLAAALATANNIRNRPSLLLKCESDQYGEAEARFSKLQFDHVLSRRFVCCA